MFRKVLLGDKRKAGVTGGVEEVVFAISDDGENLRVFREVFDGGRSISRSSGGNMMGDGDDQRLEATLRNEKVQDGQVAGSDDDRMNVEIRQT